MNPAIKNINHYRGDAFSLVLTLKDGNNNPINLDTYVVKMAIKRNAQSATPSLLLTEGDGITVVNNQVTISRNIDLAGGVYMYDMEFTKSNGLRYTYLAGSFTIKDDVTR